MDQVGYATSRAESVVQFLTVFLVFLLVLALTYFTTRFVGNFQKSATINKNFEAIETYKIANGKYLQLVRIGEKYYAIAIGKDTVTTVCEIPKEDIVIKSSTDIVQGADSFKTIMENAKKRICKGGNKNEE